MENLGYVGFYVSGRTFNVFGPEKRRKLRRYGLKIEDVQAREPVRAKNDTKGQPCRGVLGRNFHDRATHRLGIQKTKEMETPKRTEEMEAGKAGKIGRGTESEKRRRWKHPNAPRRWRQVKPGKLQQPQNPKNEGDGNTQTHREDGGR